MAVELFIPKLGQTVEEVKLIRWLVPDGAKVAQGQELLEVETDKATFPIESPADGHLHIGPFVEEQVVPVLTVVAIIGKPDERFAAKTAAPAVPAPATPAAAAPAAKKKTTDLFIPKLGQTVEEVKLIRWLVPDGAKVAQGQELLEVETDKATFPIESPADGHLHIGPFPEGEVVAVLAVVAVIGGPDDRFETGTPTAPAAPATMPAAPAADAPRLPVAAVPSRAGRMSASPRARRLAREKGVDLATVTPTGNGGARIVARDIEALAGTTAAGVRERVPLKGVRKLIAENMAASAHTTARVTLLMEIDATALVDLRTHLKDRLAKEWGFAPGYNDVLVKLVAEGLRKFPYLNARLTSDAIELLEPVHIGLAVDTDRGLMVPVVRDADRKDLRQIGSEFRDLAERAKTGRALPDELTGGTFTITNLGMYDVDAFTPVIRLPEAAILGVGRIAPKPAVRDGVIVVRQLWTLCLVFDHRLVDGAPAARFLQYLKQRIEGLLELP